MANSTEIEWTDATWNPVTGCTKISAGCDHCYAKRFSERFRGTRGHPFETGFDLTLRPERLEQPLRWREPRMIFVNSMSDLFQPAIDFFGDLSQPGYPVRFRQWRAAMHFLHVLGWVQIIALLELAAERGRE
jgi:hypothetical protein